MIHPDTKLSFISPEIGHGIIATRFIPKGTITWVRDELDQVITPQRLRELGALYEPICDKYCFMDGKGDHILCWDHARFMNHSCDATCLSPGYSFEIAVGDIEPGQELTDDYGMLNIDQGFDCLCGSAGCRGRVGPQDIHTLAEMWDQRIRGCFAMIEAVQQPLWKLVKEKRAVTRAVRDARAIASCRRNFVGLNGKRQLMRMRVAV
jgi:hypothetical protein